MRFLEIKQRKDEIDALIESIMSGQSHLSFSSIKAFATGGTRGFINYKLDKKSTGAMDNGKAFHCAILEPERYADEYFVFDDSAKCAELVSNVAKSPRATAEYKAWKAEQLAKFEGKIEVSLEDHENYLNMAAYFKECNLTSKVFSDIYATEKNYFFNRGGFKINAKVDALIPCSSIDIKTIAQCNDKKCRWAITDNMYLMQGGIYSLATGIKKHQIIFIDSDCNVGRYIMGADKISQAVDQFDYYLAMFRDAAECGDWTIGAEFFNGEVLL